MYTDFATYFKICKQKHDYNEVYISSNKCVDLLTPFTGKTKDK